MSHGLSPVHQIKVYSNYKAVPANSGLDKTASLSCQYQSSRFKNKSVIRKVIRKVLKIFSLENSQICLICHGVLTHLLQSSVDSVKNVC